MVHGDMNQKIFHELFAMEHNLEVTILLYEQPKTDKNHSSNGLQCMLSQLLLAVH